MPPEDCLPDNPFSNERRWESFQNYYRRLHGIPDHYQYHQPPPQPPPAPPTTMAETMNKETPSLEESFATIAEQLRKIIAQLREDRIQAINDPDCSDEGEEEGYPGSVAVTTTYTLTSSTTMRLDMEAVPENKATSISLAQHTYWNLAGHNSGDVLDHRVQIWANHITPVDENTVPTGEIMPVKGTVFDFTAERRVGESIREVGLGYDHNYVLDCGEENDGLQHAAKVTDPSSSRVLNLWSNAPGKQFYTGNYVNGVQGKGGAVYNKHAGLCLETQGFPNAINTPNFPSVVVLPDRYLSQNKEKGGKNVMIFDPGGGTLDVFCFPHSDVGLVDKTLINGGGIDTSRN